MHEREIEEVVERIDPAANRILGMSVEEARARVASGRPEEILSIEGSFALVGRDGAAVRMKLRAPPRLHNETRPLDRQDLPA